MNLKRKLGLIFLHYLRLLAKLQLLKINFCRRLRRKSPVIIVGITGSAGKTSTMHAIVAALQKSFQIKYSEKANSESGIPLNILGLSMKDYSFKDWLRVALLSPLKLLVNWQDYDVYVVEMGVDEPIEPKNMGYLLRIIRPKIAVFTSVTSVHSQQFEQAGFKDPLTAIAREKGRLLTALPADGWAILNRDDPLVWNQQQRIQAKVISVGRQPSAKVRFYRYSVSQSGTKFSYLINNNAYQLEIPNLVLPSVYGYNFGFALAVARALNRILPRSSRLSKTMAEISQQFRLPPGRSTLIPGIRKTLIIDSSYNASPAAMLTMLDLLDRLGQKTGRKKIAVLGDMRELGDQSAKEHRRIARKAVKVADQIVLVGPQMKEYFLPAALEAGFSQKKIGSFLKAGQAARFLKSNLRGGELILVKGSQNTIFLEIIVEALMEDKSQADQLLCRRGSFWSHQRQPFL